MRAILTYHSIDESRSPISVSAGQFAGHVRWLASGRVRVVPLEELVQLGDDQDAVALTFDDGFSNFASHAANLLLDNALTATVFVVTGRVGTTNAWGGRPGTGVPELPLMEWDELARLHERGISLGAHTRSHPALPELTGSELEAEIAGSADDLRERLAVKPKTFAYPYGAVSPEAAGLAHRAFAISVTTELSMVRVDNQRHLLPRLDMFYYREPGRLERWGTPAFQRHLWFRSELRWARSLLAGRA